MDRQQFANLAIGIKSAYPASKVLDDSASMDFWYMMLQDIEYSIAENAIMEHISTNKYPPSIAEVRRLCMSRCTEAILSFDEAWGTVQKAMSKYGCKNPELAYEMMDNLTVSIVKNLGWNNLCLGENQTANRANFREAYEEKARNLQKKNQLPQFVAERKNRIIEQIAGNQIIEQKANPVIEDKKYEHHDPPEDLNGRINKLKRGLMSGTE